MTGLTHTFEIGQEVSFERNMLVKADNTYVIAQVINQQNGKENKQVDLTYIIEHEMGWIPNSLRKTKYNLDGNKKYLFVLESELT